MIPVEELRRRIGGTTWYHGIDLGNGVRTFGSPYQDLWNNIRKVRGQIDYTGGRRVLDLASWDGMWAFEAEKLGASLVVATDVSPTGLPNFLLCREALDSRVLPFYDLPVEDLADRLLPRFPEKFDIIQHFGLLYHVEGPTLGLRQCRKVINEQGGRLLLETAVVRREGTKEFYEDDAFAVFNNKGGEIRHRIYNEPSTVWVPTMRCVLDMLEECGFSANIASVSILPQPFKMSEEWNVGRACMVCVAK